MAHLKKRIRDDPRLAKDLDYLIKKTRWHPQQLVFMLYWDSDMMHADSRSLLKKFTVRNWPVERETLRRMLKEAPALAARIQQVNSSTFSPAQTAILRNSRGAPLHPKLQSYIQETFTRLPGIIRSYCAELRRKFEIVDEDWEIRLKNHKVMLDLTRRHSLYESIRSAAPDKRYHANRLHRLVSVSRKVRGLPPIDLRAFTIWLNKLRRKYSAKSAPVPPPTTS
jgi:hypothetical protein